MVNLVCAKIPCINKFIRIIKISLKIRSSAAALTSEHFSLTCLNSNPKNLYLLGIPYFNVEIFLPAFMNVDYIYKYSKMCENKKEFDESLYVYLTSMCFQPSKMQSRVVYVLFIFKL